MEKNIVVNGNAYVLKSVTGKVLNTTKSMETSVQGSVSGGGGRLRDGSGKLKAVDLNLASTTIVHDQFFLEDEAGQEHSFQLQGFNIACREGNSLTVVSAFKPGQLRGPYVAVLNHSTQNRYFNERAINSLCSPSSLLYLVGFLVAIILELKVFSGFWLLLALFIATGIGFAAAHGNKTGKGISAFKSNIY
jgi:hypothetical protein